MHTVTANIQVVPFHPEAEYASDDEDSEEESASQQEEGARPPSHGPGGDAAEYVTRSPVPLLHLLRTSDVERAEKSWSGPDIPEANASRLRGMGAPAVGAMLAKFKRMVAGHLVSS